jgi:hypothetical protein
MANITSAQEPAPVKKDVGGAEEGVGRWIAAISTVGARTTLSGLHPTYLFVSSYFPLRLNFLAHNYFPMPFHETDQHCFGRSAVGKPIKQMKLLRRTQSTPPSIQSPPIHSNRKIQTETQVARTGRNILTVPQAASSTVTGGSRSLLAHESSRLPSSVEVPIHPLNSGKSSTTQNNCFAHS